jgi:hypothetical protein
MLVTDTLQRAGLFALGVLALGTGVFFGGIALETWWGLRKYRHWLRAQHGKR